ncbi:DinB family protein [Gracilimonas sp.]|uniref:DinB family protein n=1 Tax=Gracilimonas sp. TaxID=1974203 RepID=UPI0032EF7BA8
MNVNDIRNLYEYHYWSNEKIFKEVAKLTNQEFTQSIAGGHSSIRNTLVHLLSAEWGWLDRCGGYKRGPSLKADDYPIFKPLLDDWNMVKEHMYTFLSQLDDKKINNYAEYSGKESKTRSMPIGELLHHVIIHGVHHRGQLAILLRELGKPTESFDILFYYAEKHGVEAW